MFNFNNMTTKFAKVLLEEIGGLSEQDFGELEYIKLFDVTYDRYEEKTTYIYKIVFEDDNEGGWFRTSLIVDVDKLGECVSIDYSGCPDHELAYPTEQSAIDGCNHVNFEE